MIQTAQSCLRGTKDHQHCGSHDDVPCLQTMQTLMMMLIRSKVTAKSNLEAMSEFSGISRQLPRCKHTYWQMRWTSRPDKSWRLTQLKRKRLSCAVQWTLRVLQDGRCFVEALPESWSVLEASQTRPTSQQQSQELMHTFESFKLGSI